MFDGKTVVLLGAGTSVDFGLPLGAELWRGVRESATSCKNSLRQLQKKHPNGTSEAIHALLVKEAQLNNPQAFALHLALDAVEHDAKRLTIGRLVELLDGHNVHASVDDFTKDNSSAAAPVSALVAGILFAGLYDNRGDEGWRRKPTLMAAEFPDPRDSTRQLTNWVRRFVGLCRTKLLNGVSGRLTIVSFNYDRLFETIAREVWSKSEKAYPPFDECIEVVYPYGAFESLDPEVHNPNEFLSRQCMAFALAGNHSAEAGRVARIKIQHAERLFLCGFSCAESAIELLKLADTGALIYAQNYRYQDLRLSRILTGRLNVPSEHIEDHDMATLISSGFFERGEADAPQPKILQGARSSPKHRRRVR